MERLILIARILGALLFTAAMFLYFSEKVSTALLLGSLASICVAVVLAAERGTLYRNYFVKRRKT